MPIACDTFNIYPQFYQVLQVFLHFGIPFPIGQTIQLGKLDAVIPVDYQT